MLHLIKKIKNNSIIACSGGVDSMVLCDFLKRGKKDFALAFFHHGTKTSDEALEFLEVFSNKNNIKLFIGKINIEKPRDKSPEEFWRDERYKFLRSLKEPILTAHHLDDVVETWIFSSLRGQGKLIPYENNGVFRPFLLNRKSSLVKWAEDKNVPYITDQSNFDDKYDRNKIRNNLMPEILKINPGIHTMIRKKILKENKEIT